MDFEKHNEQVKKVWDAYEKGEPIRIPMIIGMNPRMIILDNTRGQGLSFERYCNDPQVMLETQLKFCKYEACEVMYDHEMGIPKDGWFLYPDFQNSTECGWLGAPMGYYDNAVPFTVPILQDDANKTALMDKGIPGLFDNLMGKILEFYQYFNKMKDSGYTYEGKPIKRVDLAGLITDGPMTMACMLRGATEFCIDLYEDEAYALALMEFLTEAAIFRIKGLRKFLGLPEKSPSLHFADDSIQLISCDDYERLVLPFHRRLIRELTDGSGKNSIHLCGDATRHFKKIQDELNVYYFDTGFPVKFAEVLRSLSPETQLVGGVHAGTLFGESPEKVAEETKRVCDEVKPISKKFILRDANNVSPNTPLKNIGAMYEAVKQYGVY